MSAVIVHADEVNREHRLARASAESAVSHAIRCGELLLAKKADLPHGEFMTWVQASCEFKYSTAARYMKAATQSSTGVEISTLRHLFPSGRADLASTQDLESDAGVRFDPPAKGEAARYRELRRQMDMLKELLARRRVEADELRPALDAWSTGTDAERSALAPKLRRWGELVQDWSLIDRVISTMVEMTLSAERAADNGMTWAEWASMEPAPWMDLKVTPAQWYRGSNQEKLLDLLRHNSPGTPLVCGDYLDEGHKACVMIQEAPDYRGRLDLVVQHPITIRMMREPVMRRGIDDAITKVTGRAPNDHINWCYLPAKPGTLWDWLPTCYAERRERMATA